MNIKPSKKYGISPEKVENKALKVVKGLEPYLTCTESVILDRFDKKNTKEKRKN